MKIILPFLLLLPALGLSQAPPIIRRNTTTNLANQASIIIRDSGGTPLVPNVPSPPKNNPDDFTLPNGGAYYGPFTNLLDYGTLDAAGGLFHILSDGSFYSGLFFDNPDGSFGITGGNFFVSASGIAKVAGLTNSALTASKLVGTDANKALNSISTGTGLTLSGTTLSVDGTFIPSTTSAKINYEGLDSYTVVYTNNGVGTFYPALVSSTNIFAGGTNRYFYTGDHMYLYTGPPASGIVSKGYISFWNDHGNGDGLVILGGGDVDVIADAVQIGATGGGASALGALGGHWMQYQNNASAATNLGVSRILEYRAGTQAGGLIGVGWGASAYTNDTISPGQMNGWLKVPTWLANSQSSAGDVSVGTLAFYFNRYGIVAGTNDIGQNIPYTGNGAGLTNMPAASMTGTVTNPIVSPSITGNGAGLTNVLSSPQPFMSSDILAPSMAVGAIYFGLSGGWSTSTLNYQIMTNQGSTFTVTNFVSRYVVPAGGFPFGSGTNIVVSILEWAPGLSGFSSNWLYTLSGAITFLGAQSAAMTNSGVNSVTITNGNGYVISSYIINAASGANSSMYWSGQYQTIKNSP